MKTFDVTVVATVTMQVDAETRKDAIDIVHYKLPRQKLSPYDGRVEYHLTIEDIHLTEVGIMDTSNGHCPCLVDKINQAYIKKPYDFGLIIDTLINRDLKDFMETTGHNKPSEMNAKIKYHDYCQFVADDQDLKTIINYCRI